MSRPCLMLGGILILSFIYSTVLGEGVHYNKLTLEVITPKPDLNDLHLTDQEDAVITRRIHSFTKKSPALSALKILVKTNNGFVTLKGVMDFENQASTLIAFVQSIIGVKDIDASALTIKDSTQPFTDMLITAKIKGLFIREKIVGSRDIAALNVSVETREGVVYLSGVISRSMQLQTAIQLISEVKGVKKVVYSLKKVSAPAL